MFSEINKRFKLSKPVYESFMQITAYQISSNSSFFYNSICQISKERFKEVYKRFVFKHVLLLLLYF